MQLRHVLVRALGLAAIGILSTAGMPDNGMPDNGMPDNGMPDNGMPDNGMPDNGNSPDALINSPLFFNAATHAYWVGHPFTAASINAAGSPLRQTISDKFSALVMSYQWQLCHPQGDNATVTDANGQKHTFLGRIGLCVLAGGHGWHKDKPLDLATARWLSAATITQVNRLQVHNRYSLRGPLPQQLTAMSPSLTSYIYKFGTHDPVEALNACTAASSGKANCGWKPHFVGLGKKGQKVKISANSHGKKMLLQVNLGIHGANVGSTGAIAISGNAGVVNPHVEFIVPEGGTFNVQWAADPRPTSRSLPATIAPPALTATPSVKFPADEIFVFSNREMYATAMLYNLSAADHNILPIPGTADGKPVANCEPRVNSDGFIEYCVASPQINGKRTQAQQGCIQCQRNPKPGGKLVVFPNAHMWLSASWTRQQDYYSLRSCSSNLATCVAKYEGEIDGGAHPCAVQSKNTDTNSPRPYAGQPKPLQDAFGCHIGAGGDTGFGVTTLFANYGKIGACWASKPGDPACGYRPAKKHCEKKQQHGKDKEKGHRGDDDDQDCD